MDLIAGPEDCRYGVCCKASEEPGVMRHPKARVGRGWSFVGKNQSVGGGIAQLNVKGAQLKRAALCESRMSRTAAAIANFNFGQMTPGTQFLWDQAEVLGISCADW